jgi:hypothetical protein
MLHLAHPHKGCRVCNLEQTLDTATQQTAGVMTAMFPLIYCSKCGSRMRVGFVQAADEANDVTYACTPCGTMETITVPAPGGISYSPAVERSTSISLSSRRARQF